MAISTEDFVKQIETMSVLDLSNLVKALEERFGVSAAAAAAPAAAAGPAAAAAPVEAQTEFAVILRPRRRPKDLTSKDSSGRGGMSRPEIAFCCIR